MKHPPEIPTALKQPAARYPVPESSNFRMGDGDLLFGHSFSGSGPDSPFAVDQNTILEVFNSRRSFFIALSSRIC